MAVDTNSGQAEEVAERDRGVVQFVGRYRDEVLAVLLMAIGATLIAVPRADLVGGAMVAVGPLAWVSDWLAG